MTREEALDELSVLLERMDDTEDYTYTSDISVEAIEIAIKALSAIEAIKAEIEEEWQADMYEDKFGVADCLKIIEKHTSRKDGESE